MAGMKVLVAVDGSPCSDAAVHEAGRYPWPDGSEIRIVTVDAPLGESSLRAGGVSGTSAYDELVHRQREEAHHRLDKAVALLRKSAPHLVMSSSLLEGAAKEDIPAEARRWNADVVVVGSQGHGAVKRLFLGSVSLAVVLNSPCSVLVVRLPQVDA